MDSSTSTYRPQSPDLSSYTPQSPDLSGLGSATHSNWSVSSAPSLGSFGSPQSYRQDNYNSGQFPVHNYHSLPTSDYRPPPHNPASPNYQMAPGQRMRVDHDGDYYPPNGPATRTRRGLASPHLQQQPQYQLHHQLQEQQPSHQFQPQQSHMLHMQSFNGHALPQSTHNDGTMAGVQSHLTDPTHGVQLKTSFPVARIKRIMQADEDIGKVAQVTPHIVSRALELFMIKLITASADQANGGGVVGKGQKRILAQHLKRVIMTDDNFDFLREIANKVPDAPVKAKKDVGSDSDESKPAKRKGKKRKDSADDF